MERNDRLGRQNGRIWQASLFGAISLAAVLTVSPGCRDMSEKVRHPDAPSRHQLALSDFTPAAQCGNCHVEIYQQWRGSAHSQAAMDPIFQKLLPQAAKDLGELGVGFCLKCHTPVSTVAGEVKVHSPVSLPLNLKPVSMEGVTCDFCHTFSGEENFGKDISPGIYLYPRKGQTAVK